MAIVTTSSRKKRTSLKFTYILIAVIAVGSAAFFAYKFMGEKNAVSTTGEYVQAIKTESTDTKIPAKPIGSNKPVDVLEKAESNPILIDDEDLETPPETVIKVDDGEKQSTTVRKPIKRKFFDNKVENQLEVLSNRGVKFRNPPKIKMSEEEIMAYLKAPIQINEDDDAETIAAKERTAEMKTIALEYIEQGGTYEQFIQEQAKASTEEAETRRTVQKEVSRLVKEEGLKAAEEYLAEINPQLKEAGLKEVGIPLYLRKQAELAAEEAAKQQ